MLLKSVSLVVLLSLGSVPFSVAAAWAEEHIVIILGSAYFPQHTVVAEGDVVRFVNVSGQSHTVRQDDGRWETLEMANGEELLVEIVPGIEGAFHGKAKRKITGRFDMLRRSVSK